MNHAITAGDRWFAENERGLFVLSRSKGACNLCDKKSCFYTETGEGKGTIAPCLKNSQYWILIKGFILLKEEKRL